MALSPREQAGLAAYLGHRDLTVTQTPRGLWFFTCSCGAKSTLRMTQGDAAGAASHHLKVILRAYRATGRPVRFADPSSEGKGASAPAAESRAS